MTQRRAITCAMLLVAGLLAPPAAAQYPNRPIRLAVPFPPAGAADLAARPEVREQRERHAFDARSSLPDELGLYLKDQVDVWIRTAREAGIVPDQGNPAPV
ncbi:MAG: hypothetical protein ABI569_04095 [Casimicrobiaceae bacterium]